MHIRKTRCIIGLFVQVQARDPGIFGKDSAKISHDVQGDHYMKTLKEFFRKETVFCVSFLLALISAAAVRPDPAYLTYPDYRTLALLFCFMIIVAGFQWLGIFSLLGETLLKKASSLRNLSVLMVLLCFFSSMIITNDVTLITFVPFTILVYQMVGREDRILRIVVLETIAANLGSMATPPGNPQNLYLCSRYDLGMGSFFLTMLPFAAISLVLLLFCICFVRREPIRVYFKESSPLEQPRLLAVFAVLFLMCLLTIFHVLSYQVLTLCVLACMLLFSRDLFRSVDYFLLATFICFFIFSGNLGRMEAVRAFLSGLMEKNGMLTAVLSSQVISNVPAAVLLSSFTENWKALLLGTNLGGLGTPIASLASLISLKFYLKTEQADLKSYLLLFLSLNAGGLLLLLAAACIL